MKKKNLIKSGLFLLGFIIWTILIQTVDVAPIGPRETNVGFAAHNGWFHGLTGVNLTLYTITDWLGLVPIFICLTFAAVGAVQLFKRKNLFKVDFDIRMLGVYYALVIFCYLAFEMVPINYRPILIEGRLEASYPSSTTLLVLSVMPTLSLQAERRIKNIRLKYAIQGFSWLFSAFMVVGRSVSGVHWLSDIVGAVLLSCGLYHGYRAVLLMGNRCEK